jgi:hypothetical protein
MGRLQYPHKKTHWRSSGKKIKGREVTKYKFAMREVITRAEKK